MCTGFNQLSSHMGSVSVLKQQNRSGGEDVLILVKGTTRGILALTVVTLIIRTF